MEQKHTYFFDGSSPTYVLVNPEVAEGDLVEAFPLFSKRLLFFLLAACFSGSIGYLYVTRHVLCYITKERNPSV